MNDNLSPIVLFVYARPEHTQRTLAALAANAEASESELYVYADAPRNAKDQAQVVAVHQLLTGITGFGKVSVIEREHNYGLAQISNIMDSA